ncbi:GNAT family N-acetyltransferase [Tunturibacter psychrotolerans]|uniref:GNAT family N-acetyltransferase n=1 Tax=Tunturiibacter psychrotolerans TaxID=3069686 RepID=A0AAU7ZNS2_9BACT
MSVVDYRVREGVAADLVGVMRLEEETAEAPHWAAAEYAAIVDSGGLADGAVRRRLFVAEDEAGLLGFAVGKVLVSEVVNLGELESVAVGVSTRRSGVGRMLCEAVIRWCVERGATEMELEVRSGSAGAIALYRGLGFVAVGERAGYYRDPDDDALLMQLKLAEGA